MKLFKKLSKKKNALTLSEVNNAMDDIFQQNTEDFFKVDVDERSFYRLQSNLEDLTGAAKEEIKGLFSDLRNFLTVSKLKNPQLLHRKEKCFENLQAIRQKMTAMAQKKDQDNTIESALTYAQHFMKNQIDLIRDTYPDSYYLQWFKEEDPLIQAKPNQNFTY